MKAKLKAFEIQSEMYGCFIVFRQERPENKKGKKHTKALKGVVYWHWEFRATFY